jgi:MFS family permease
LKQAGLEGHNSTRHEIMFSQRTKNAIFLIEGLNAIATTCFFYYLYFFTEQHYHFDKLQNLSLAAGMGLLYMFASAWCGRFAQKHGYFLPLKIGFATMAAVLTIGCAITSLAGQFVVMAACNIGMCFTWPTLEAIVSEKESPARLQKMVGIYNLVWAGGGALAYFAGGAMLEHWGLRSMFAVPAMIILAQLGLVLRLERALPRPAGERESTTAGAPVAHREEHLRSPVSPGTFLRMAWLANPFAYLAINTVIAVMPNLAKQLALSPQFAGFCGSLWMFVRFAAFWLLWRWSGWHYRFRWLAGAYFALIAGFGAILLAPNIGALMAAQCVFGFATGLIYYSSLYYAMDVGETKGEHGGLHEAAIGAGSCAGPAIGAAALHFFPDLPGSSAWAVSAMLLLGLGGLGWLRWRR